MGSRERAERISAAVPNPIAQRIALYVLDSCGNCQERVACLIEQPLEARGGKGELGRLLRELTLVCPAGTEPGKLANLLSDGLRNNCRTCDSLKVCVRALNLHASKPVTDDALVAQIEKCLNCGRLPFCVQSYLELYDLADLTSVGWLYAKKFTKCKAGNLQRRLLG